MPARLPFDADELEAFPPDAALGTEDEDEDEDEDKDEEKDEE
jgi:hypothetical protein